MYSGPTNYDPLAQSNPLSARDVYMPTGEAQVLPGPALPQYGNQHDGGVPLDTPWDIPVRAYDPLPDTLVYGVPNLGAPGRGNPLLYPFADCGDGLIPTFTNYSDVLPFTAPSRLIVYVDDLNYQGVAPMDLQPLLNAPEPWTRYTPQQMAGGG